jgi:large subunit ribosomal protein L35
MPKMKSRSAAKKRFRAKPNGTFKRKKAYKSHILTKKNHKRRARLGKRATTDTVQSKKLAMMIQK